jgi:hypothetical protein
VPRARTRSSHIGTVSRGERTVASEVIRDKDSSVVTEAVYEISSGERTLAQAIPRYARGVAHYIFNLVAGDASQATGLLRARMLGVGAEEPHRDALAPGDLALVYLAAPERKFIARAELASAVHDWTPWEERVYPGDCPGGVLLAHVEEWNPPIPMSTVLSRIDRSAGARADFEVGVVRITADEYETALAVAAARTTSAG